MQKGAKPPRVRRKAKVRAHERDAVSVRKQGAWGLWWLCLVTFGIYYFIWYDRINKELTSITGTPKDATCAWWSQLIPFYSLYALAKTAGRVNAAHVALGSTTRVSPFVTWFWAPAWYASQTRYLQRRINILHDIQSSRSLAQPVPS